MKNENNIDKDINNCKDNKSVNIENIRERKITH